MPEYVYLEECLKNKEEYARMFKTKIVIYPTDTVYGIGCDATNETLVDKIFQIKKRHESKPMSVIAPSFEWIWENFIVDKKIKEIVRRYLPGPYTIILKKKKRPFLEKVTAHRESAGIRIPAHPIYELIKLASVPFVTTSANISGRKHASTVEEIDKEVKEKADLIIDGGKLRGKASTLIDLTFGKPSIIERD